MLILRQQSSGGRVPVSGDSNELLRITVGPPAGLREYQSWLIEAIRDQLMNRAQQ